LWGEACAKEENRGKIPKNEGKGVSGLSSGRLSHQQLTTGARTPSKRKRLSRTMAEPTEGRLKVTEALQAFRNRCRKYLTCPASGTHGNTRMNPGGKHQSGSFKKANPKKKNERKLPKKE